MVTEGTINVEIDQAKRMMVAATSSPILAAAVGRESSSG